MPANTVRKIETTMSDRDVMLHILAHVEDLWTVLDEFRPLLALLKGPDGKPDMVGALQLRRKVRKG